MINPAESAAAAPSTKIFLNVRRHETHHRAAPATPSANAGTPARDSVSRTVTAAAPRPIVAARRSHLGKSAAAAAMSTGPSRHRYIERLLGWSMLPGTRCMPRSRRCLRPMSISRPAAITRPRTNSRNSRPVRANIAAASMKPRPRASFHSSNTPKIFGSEPNTEPAQ